MTRPLLGLLPLLALTACAYDAPFSGAATVVQHKYDHLNCDQLSANIKSTQENIAKLRGLMDKAAQENAGVLIGSAVYGSTLTEAYGNLRALQTTYAEKNCAASLPATPPGPKKSGPKR